MSADIALLDVVALTHDIPQRKLLRGQVGTVVEVVGPDRYLVEFSDKQGRTYALEHLGAEQLMVLRYDPVGAPQR